MDEGMTLEQVRDWHREKAKLARCDRDEEKARLHDAMADALTTHLAQPSQAVDVGAIREVLTELERVLGDQPGWRSDIDKLTRAIGNAQAEGWKVLDDLLLAGAALANCAFNLAQREHLTHRERRSLNESREAWDKARHLLPTPPTKATPNAHE